MRQGNVENPDEEISASAIERGDPSIAMAPCSASSSGKSEIRSGDAHIGLFSSSGAVKRHDSTCRPDESKFY